MILEKRQMKCRVDWVIHMAARLGLSWKHIYDPMAIVPIVSWNI